MVAPSPPARLKPTLAALSKSDDPDHRAIGAYLVACRNKEPLPELPLDLNAVAAEIFQFVKS